MASAGVKDVARVLPTPAADGGDDAGNNPDAAKDDDNDSKEEISSVSWC